MSQERVKVPIEWMREHFAYDPLTGDITNKSTGRVIAPPTNPLHYRGVMTWPEVKRYAAHRVAWALHYGEQHPPEIDHINGNRHDNRIVNLRAATRQQNMRNRRPGSKSGYKGVKKQPQITPTCREAWNARMKINGKAINIGTFDTAEEAGLAYEVAAERMYGEFAFHRREIAK